MQLIFSSGQSLYENTWTRHRRIKNCLLKRSFKICLACKIGSSNIQPQTLRNSSKNFVLNRSLSVLRRSKIQDEPKNEIPCSNGKLRLLALEGRCESLSGYAVPRQYSCYLESYNFHFMQSDQHFEQHQDKTSRLLLDKRKASNFTCIFGPDFMARGVLFLHFGF